MKDRYSFISQWFSRAHNPPGDRHIYCLTAVTCLLAMSALAIPLLDNADDPVDSRNVVVASRIAEEVAEGLVAGPIEPGDIPEEILERYGQRCEEAGAYGLEASIVYPAGERRPRVEVSVTWWSSGEERELTLLRPLGE